MKLPYAVSLILVWKVADAEARHLKASSIDPTHLLLGLCKVVDLDLPELVSKDSPDRDAVLEEFLREIRRLRTVYRAAGLDAKIFRRKYRQALPEGRFVPDDSGRLRRTSAAKRVFADAERFALLGSSAVYPVHLFYASLQADDEYRDVILTELNVERKRLLTVARKEVLSKRLDSTTPSAKARTRWN